MECNPGKSTPESAVDLSTSQSTIYYHSKKDKKSEQAGCLASSCSQAEELGRSYIHSD